MFSKYSNNRNSFAGNDKNYADGLLSNLGSTRFSITLKRQYLESLKTSNLQSDMFFLRAVDAATIARKMIVPMTKMMTMMNTTPSTPSTITKSSS
jgi:hypothetical protein